jgi:type IV secretion system protein VirD4
LATPDEIMRLKSPAKDDRDMIVEPGSMLIFVAGHAPIYGTQSLYFRDPVFSARVKLPVPAGAPGIAASRTGAASSRMPFKL